MHRIYRHVSPSRDSTELFLNCIRVRSKLEQFFVRIVSHYNQLKLRMQTGIVVQWTNDGAVEEIQRVGYKELGWRATIMYTLLHHRPSVAPKDVCTEYRLSDAALE